MPRYSANVGFLWHELGLCDAIRAAAKAGFDAVECHWPYELPTADVIAVLEETGLPLLGINTVRGDAEAGDFGLSALPGREDAAIAAIDAAIAYGAEIGCRNVHVMAGKTGGGTAAEAVYQKNLDYACTLAAPHGMNILIEPMNDRDAPGYHLTTVEAGVKTIEAVGKPNLKVMFDCYHVQIMQGDIRKRLEANLAHVGHIQFAAVPDRGEPDAGELNYPDILAAIDAMGYEGYVGAEYKPRGTTDEGIGWFEMFRR